MRLYRFGLALSLVSMAYPQAADQADHYAKDFQAQRLTAAVSIDGYLHEPAWGEPGLTDFVQRDPLEGEEPTQRTEVWVAYDQSALYIAARLYDSAPDSIVRRLARRDEDTSADFFIFGVDPWHDHRSGFYFRVNAAGAIEDGTFSNDAFTDDSWDGVWESAVTVDEQGWNLEIKVPFSQLRFPKKEEHVWGMNFARWIERNQELDYYVMVPRNSSGDVSWFAHMTGIAGIERPSTLELLPYSAGRAEYLHPESGDPFNDGSNYFGQAGLDIKMGLTSSMTLDATINPDFGQVEVDPAVINLGYFETHYEEKRPFFVEGASIFGFGNGGTTNNWSFNYGAPTFFYSRRAGRPPQLEPTGDYDFSSIPTNTSILGAAKISGKLNPQWSLGLANVVTGREEGRLDSAGNRFRETVEPLANYSVVRLQREISQGRHGLGLLGTSTYRDLRTANGRSTLPHNAQAGGVDGWVTLDPEGTYIVSGWLGGTRIFGQRTMMTDRQGSFPHYLDRPDAGHLELDSNATAMTGMAGRLYINKEKGDVVFNSGLAATSPGFDVGELGFQYEADQINWHVAGGYHNQDPGKILRSSFIALAFVKNWDFGGTPYGGGYFLFSDGQFLNYWSLGFEAGYFPEYNDKYITRGGVWAKHPRAYFINWSVSTDSRKDLSFYGSLQYGRSTRRFWSLNSGITWKPNTRLLVQVSPEYMYDETEAFYLDHFSDPTATNTHGQRYIFGEVVQHSLSLSTRVNFTFSPTLSLQLYTQPLIFAIDYFDYKELAESGTFKFNIYGDDGQSTVSIDEEAREVSADPDGPGGPADTLYFGTGDFNFKSLKVNAVLRWEFRPGSVFYLAWTQERVDNDEYTGAFDPGPNTRALFGRRPDNILLLKFTYWLNP